MTRITPVIGIALISVLLGACTIHQIDVQQGNVITQESVAKLTPGMPKKQVSLLLGTPLINDPFHKDRWDYVYRFVVGSTAEVQEAHVTLLFKEDRLSDINIQKQPPPEADIRTPELIRR